MPKGYALGLLDPSEASLAELIMKEAVGKKANPRRRSSDPDQSPRVSSRSTKGKPRKVIVPAPKPVEQKKPPTPKPRPLPAPIQKTKFVEPKVKPKPVKEKVNNVLYSNSIYLIFSAYDH